MKYYQSKIENLDAMFEFMVAILVPVTMGEYGQHKLCL